MPLNREDKKAAVLLFITHDCPIANSYAPEIKRLCADYQPKSVAFYIVYVDPSLTAEQARVMRADNGYDCPLMLLGCQSCAG